MYVAEPVVGAGPVVGRGRSHPAGWRGCDRRCGVGGLLCDFRCAAAAGGSLQTAGGAELVLQLAAAQVWWLAVGATVVAAGLHIGGAGVGTAEPGAAAGRVDPGVGPAFGGAPSRRPVTAREWRAAAAVAVGLQRCCRWLRTMRCHPTCPRTWSCSPGSPSPPLVLALLVVAGRTRVEAAPWCVPPRRRPVPTDTAHSSRLVTR